jgi:hypothetical protein
MFHKNLVFVCLSIIFALASCERSTSERGEEMQEFNAIASSLTAREMLDRHFQYKIGSNSPLLNLTTHESQRNGVWNLRNLKRLDILSIEEKWVDESQQDFYSDRNFFAATSFIVEYEVEYKREKQQNNGRYTDFYVLIKEHEYSPWQVYSWGTAMA